MVRCCSDVTFFRSLNLRDTLLSTAISHERSILIHARLIASRVAVAHIRQPNFRSVTVGTCTNRMAMISAHTESSRDDCDDWKCCQVSEYDFPQTNRIPYHTVACSYSIWSGKVESAAGIVHHLP